MKKLLPLAVGSLLVLGLSACSGTSTAAPVSDAPGADALSSADGVTSITLWHGLGNENGAALDALVTQFNEANADTIHVESTYQGSYADLLAKYTASVRDESSPTVLLAGDVATGYISDVNLTVSASDMAAANPDDLDLSTLSETARNYYTVNDVQEAVPMNMSTPVLWVNTDMLDQAGVDPDDLATFDGMVEGARAITQATSVPAIGQYFDNWWVEQFAAASGESFCTPANGREGDAATSIAITEGTTADAISTMAQLYADGVGVDVGTSGGDARSAFLAEKVAMIFSSSASASALASAATFGYTALPFPTIATDGSAGTTVGGSALWLSSTATDAEKVAGWKLESYLAGAEGQEQFSAATGYVPVNTDVATEPDAISQVFADQVASTPVTSETAGCVSGAMTAMREAITSQIQAAYRGDISVEDALAQATADAEVALERYSEQAAN